MCSKATIHNDVLFGIGSAATLLRMRSKAMNDRNEHWLGRKAIIIKACKSYEDSKSDRSPPNLRPLSVFRSNWTQLYPNFHGPSIPFSPSVPGNAWPRSSQRPPRCHPSCSPSLPCPAKSHRRSCTMTSPGGHTTFEFPTRGFNGECRMVKCVEDEANMS